MKKVFFSFAIATMMASLASCGGSSNQNTDSQDSTAVEAEAEAEAAEEAPSNLVEAADFSGVVPEGWNIERQDNGGFEFKNRDAEGPLKPTISVRKAQLTAAEAYESTSKSTPKNLIGNVELVEGMDIAGRTYAGYYYKTQYNSELEASKYYLITDLSNGTPIYVQVENIAIDDAVVQAVFASIKEK